MWVRKLYTSEVAIRPLPRSDCDVDPSVAAMSVPLDATFTIEAMATGASTDVVVVGGGVIGLACAWRLARHGARTSVVDPRPGRGAGWAAAGMLAPAGEAHFGEADLTVLTLRAAACWGLFAEELEQAAGRSVGYLRSGSLLVAVDPSDRVAADDLLGYRLELGLHASRQSSAECRQLEPLLAPGVCGGAHFPDDHQVDNRMLLGALCAACHNEQVTFIEDEVAAVSLGHDRATGVSLADSDEVSAGAVVVAAGCRSGQLGGLSDAVRPPVRPVKGLTLRLSVPDAVAPLHRIVRGLVHGRSCYLVPRSDGTVVVGATVEEKGFDLSVQAGAVGDLLDDARRVVPSVEEYELTDTATGLRPGSPDNGPIVGSTAVAGLYLATGHYRNGILLAPITAEAIAAMVTRPSEPVAEAEAFAAFPTDRFTGGRGPGVGDPSTPGIPSSSTPAGPSASSTRRS